MIRIIQKFFAFCSRENRKKLGLSVFFGVLIALFQGLKIPAIYITLTAVLTGNITINAIAISFSIILISIIGGSLLRSKATILQTEAGYGSCAEKRIEIASHMRYLPMGYFSAESLGAITSVATNTLQNLEGVATRVVMVVTEGMITTLVILLFLLFFDYRIALVLTAGFLLFLLANMILQKRSQKISALKNQADVDLVSRILEYIHGMAEVRAYHLTGERNAELESAVDRNAKRNTEMEFSVIPIITLQNFIIKTTGVAMSALSIFFYSSGSMDTVTCILMIISSFLVYASLESAGTYSALLRTVDISVDKVNAILSTPAMATEGEDIKPENHMIEAEGISFAYDRKLIINDVSLSIPDRTSLAIVGRSGSGKSTLTNLLVRFWDVSKGSITLGGHDIRAYSMDSLMKNYSFVFQHVYLFSDTIANNIRFGMPDASIEQVREAARKACCDDFITALPDGYDTVIGEGGASLSGGEKQRISIARAILKDAPIIILDEATANVDPENEDKLISAIDALTREKTVIMIAHRLKTVRNADCIIVIDEGRIRQQGTHDELMKEEGIYRSFIEERKKAVSWKI